MRAMAPNNKLKEKMLKAYRKQEEERKRAAAAAGLAPPAPKPAKRPRPRTPSPPRVPGVCLLPFWFGALWLPSFVAFWLSWLPLRFSILRAEVRRAVEESQEKTSERQNEAEEGGEHRLGRPATLYEVDMANPRSGRTEATYVGCTRFPKVRERQHKEKGAESAGLVRAYAGGVWRCVPRFRPMDMELLSTHGYFGARLRETIEVAQRIPPSRACGGVKVRGGPWVRVCDVDDWPTVEKEALEAVRGALARIQQEHGAFTGFHHGPLPGLTMRGPRPSLELEDLNRSGLAWQQLYLVILQYDLLRGSLLYDRSARGSRKSIAPEASNAETHPKSQNSAKRSLLAHGTGKLNLRCFATTIISKNHRLWHSPRNTVTRCGALHRVTKSRLGCEVHPLGAALCTE